MLVVYGRSEEIYYEYDVPTTYESTVSSVSAFTSTATVFSTSAGAGSAATGSFTLLAITKAGLHIHIRQTRLYVCS